ncbi:MAG: DUF1364 family protein [Colwellia sp.]|nr:DUF1364 family protein [Colwellia sp.]
MNIINPHMLPKIRSKAIMQGADGSPCTLRIASFYPGHFCALPDTVVGCHLPIWGKGTGTKVTDMGVAFGCMHCHDILDGRNKPAQTYIMDRYPSALAERMLHGLTETQALLIQMGALVVPDGEII